MRRARALGRVWSCWVALSLVSVVGCGSGQKLYPVKGKVQYRDGRDVSVLAGGTVAFEPADPEMPKVSARAKIQQDGSFQMGTYTEDDGAVPGKHRVVVYPPRYKGKEGPPRPYLVDEIFRYFDKSGLEIDIKGPIEDYVITVFE
jgi:hypothetical protein